MTDVLKEVEGLKKTHQEVFLECKDIDQEQALWKSKGYNQAIDDTLTKLREYQGQKVDVVEGVYHRNLKRSYKELEESFIKQSREISELERQIKALNLVNSRLQKDHLSAQGLIKGQDGPSDVVSYQDVKKFLRITSDRDRPLIEECIKQAKEYCEGKLHKKLSDYEGNVPLNIVQAIIVQASELYEFKNKEGNHTSFNLVGSLLKPYLPTPPTAKTGGDDELQGKH